MADDAAGGGVDVELRVHPEVDELGDRAPELRSVAGRRALDGADLHVLGPNRDANRLANRMPSFDRGDDSFSIGEAGDAVIADELVDFQLEGVERADEVGDERRLRPFVDLTRASELLDLPSVHHGDPVAHRERLVLVVRHVDERRPELVLDSLQLELHLLAQLHVERTERLVEEQRSRTIDERARKRNALLLAARQLPRAPLLVAFERDDAQELGDPLGVFGARARPSP